MFLCRMLQELAEGGGLVVFLLWVGKLFPQLSGYARITNKVGEFAAAFQKSVVEHIKTFSKNYQRSV